MKVNDVKFKYCDNGEHQDYHFSVYVNGINCGIIVFDDGEWKLYEGYDLNWFDLLATSAKISELNATTKADKLFGFL